MPTQIPGMLLCKYRLLPILALFYLVACQAPSSTEIANDPHSIERGKYYYDLYCSSCHSLNNQSIGPALAGITELEDPDWLRSFIRNAPEMIDGGDKRAKALLATYRQYMPAFPMLQDSNIDCILAYLHAQPASAVASADTLTGLEDPIPDSIALSDHVVDLQLLTQIPASGEFPLMTRITKMDCAANTGRLFMLDLRGKLYEMTNGTNTVYLDMATHFPNYIDVPGLATGFGSFAFHPEFENNGLLYTTHTEQPGSAPADFALWDSIPVKLQWVVDEWKVNGPTEKTLTGSHRELMRIEMVTQIHGVQDLEFNPNAQPGDPDYGMLYIGVGDGGSVENGFPEVSINGAKKIWSSILRIDPAGNNSKNGQYAIPPDNPWAADNDPETLGEIYARGFRNPHRLTWSPDGNMVASCIGHHMIEEVNLIEPGKDYGWPEREGTFKMRYSETMATIFPLDPADTLVNFTYPIAQFDHGEGNAISGGYFSPVNSKVLPGTYFFGDIVNGRLFYINQKDIKQGYPAPVHEWRIAIDGVPTTLLELSGSNRADLRFGKDCDGNFYLFTKVTGKVYRMAGEMPL